MLVARIICPKCDNLGHFDDFYPSIVEGEKQRHLNAVEVSITTLNEDQIDGDNKITATAEISRYRNNDW